MTPRILLAIGALIAVLVAPDPAAAEEAERADLVRIGLVRSSFRGLPESVVAASSRPFRALVQAQTGLPGEIAVVADVESLAQQLRQHKLQLGVFEGIEFAWAKQKYPELQPLMLAVNGGTFVRAHLLVRQDSDGTDFAALQGKQVALPQGSKEHCRLFVERHGKSAWRLAEPVNAEEALDDVVDGLVHAAVVDSAALACYERRKPGRFAKLKEAQRSEAFPAAVIAYCSGAVEKAALERFRTGMLNARHSPQARPMLTLWKITSFEAVPDEYEHVLSEIVKTYPRSVAQR